MTELLVTHQQIHKAILYVEIVLEKAIKQKNTPKVLYFLQIKHNLYEGLL